MSDAGNRISSVFIEDEMQKSYLDYSMSMITSRALPDVRDGLKPVHRRVLFGMQELGLHHNKPPKKCARVVGDVIGKYHPHGDAAVYDSLVRMAQDFSLRYRMVNGQGNFGSIDGDPPAAMRYTECRMTALAEEMLADLEKETVGFVPNYDDSLKEPSVLPSKLPFLLVNGTTGIAVGMATNMAPHNLSEVVDAIVKVVDDESISIEDLFKIIPGPDFPTGGIIYGRSGILEAYRTGKGKVIIRARAEVVKTQNDREEIVITEIPYMVNKASLLEKIADLVRQKTIEGISFIRDESDRNGMRIVIGIKKDDFGDVVLNQLYKYTMMQTTFGIINLALVDLQPRLLNLKELISHFINHRHEIVVRRTSYELKKAQERAHILEGLRIALDHIDEIVALIKGSSSPEDAQIKLQDRFALSEIQAKAILDMKLQRLTGLERDKIESEYQELLILISKLTAILESREQRMQIIKDELIDLKTRYGDPRRTEIVDATGDVEIEDLIAEEDMVITMTHDGYIKRTAVNTYRSQGRGGKGVKGMDSKENDFINTLFIASTHAYILFFTNTGRCYWLKVYRIPETARQSRGKPIVNLIDLKPEEKIAAFVPVREFDNNHFIVTATEQGVINKQPLSAYSNVRRDGINSINLDEGDRVIECKLTTGNDDIILATSSGQAVRFHESAARELGRNTRGVKGITLRGGDKVVGMIIVDESYDVLTVTENGYGKRTPVSEYRKTNRGGSGIINIKVTEKNGNVVALKGVKDGSDLMLITRNGIIIRVDVDKVSTIGRNTQGVKLISLDEDDSVIDVALCDRETDDDSEGGQTESIPEAIPEGIMEEEAEDSFKVPEEESGSEDEGQDSEGQAGTDTSKE
ncbi:MAG: DNA gyrase subunit A [Fibrobacter sp.]|jgi:DNA gyrase subunit A|nr:DNA gyrase subunit A [Fibrobacter sp.]